MERIGIIDRTYNGKSKMNDKIYNLILNMITEHLLNNTQEMYNEIDVNHNVMSVTKDEK